MLYIATLLFFPQGLLSSGMAAHAKIKQLYIIKISGPLLKIILLTLLIPNFGIWGAIYSIIISSLINGLLVFYLFQKIKT